MEIQVYEGTYESYKSRLDAEIKRNAESFVTIGYLLKVARDTDILAKSNYETVAEFAKAEYGLSPDIVSRYIAINDRYSEGGYSDRLQERFEGFGVGKLQDMLTLPDTVVEEIEPTITRRQIQEIKAEVKEEEKITPLEVMMEKPEDLPDTTQIMQTYFSRHQGAYKASAAAVQTVEDLKNALGVPTTFIGRVAGKGKYLLTTTENEGIRLVNVRTGERDSVTWEQFLEDMKLVKIDTEEPENIENANSEETFKPKQEEDKTAENQGFAPVQKSEPPAAEQETEEIKPIEEPEKVENANSEEESTEEINEPVERVVPDAVITPKEPTNEADKESEENEESEAAAEPLAEPLWKLLVRIKDRQKDIEDNLIKLKELEYNLDDFDSCARLKALAWAVTTETNLLQDDLMEKQKREEEDEDEEI